MEKLVVFAVLTFLLAPTTAYAYLDPGTGSIILQMLIAGILAAALYVRLFWDRTRQMISRLFHRRTRTEGNGKNPTRSGERADEATK